LRLRHIRSDLLSTEVLKKAGPLQLRWFARGFWISVGQLGFSLLMGADLLIIARVLGPATVVIYSCTGKLLSVLQNQPQIVAGAALPGLSHMKASESRDRTLQATTSLTQGMFLLVGVVFCIVLSINQQFVTVWLGARFFGGMMLTVLLLVNFLLRQIDYTLAITLFALGYEKLSAIRCLLDGLVSVTLARIFAERMGVEGVALGFVCGALFMAIPMDIFIFTREFKLSVPQALRPYGPYLWRIALVGSAGVAVMQRLGAMNLFTVGLMALLVGAVYMLAVVPYARTTRLGGYIDSAAATLRSAVRGWLPA
jgi:O-antigen/teichoic acid export membrane protein